MAFLSFRISDVRRRRLKRLAAERGESVQAVMGRQVERLLREEDHQVPTLVGVLHALRRHKAALHARDVAKLWVFGSVARDAARPDSDIDLIVEFAPDARVSLTGFARLGEELSDIVDARVDLAEWRTLSPHARESAERDAVAVF